MPPPELCAVCSAPAASFCAKCRSRCYCSRACQAVDWRGGHKAICNALTSVADPENVFATGFSAFDDDGRPILSSAFKVGLVDAHTASTAPAARKAPPARGAAAAPATRKVMARGWNCDLCNAEGAAGTLCSWWANTPHAGDLAFCDACVAAGKGPADARGCAQQ